jgi:hypothetical protein
MLVRFGRLGICLFPRSKYSLLCSDTLYAVGRFRALLFTCRRRWEWYSSFTLPYNAHSSRSFVRKSWNSSGRLSISLPLREWYSITTLYLLVSSRTLVGPFHFVCFNRPLSPRCNTLIRNRSPRTLVAVLRSIESQCQCALLLRSLLAPRSSWTSRSTAGRHGILHVRTVALYVHEYSYSLLILQ